MTDALQTALDALCRLNNHGLFSRSDLEQAASNLRAEHGDNAEAEARIFYHDAVAQDQPRAADFWVHVLGTLLSE